jgi:rhodanese-related sulfurtransferase
MTLGHFAEPQDARAHFAAKLSYETDPADLRTAQRGREDFVLVDSRSEAAWGQGRLPKAIHMPTAQIAERAPLEIPIDTPVVVYCWGPACNGSTNAALAFSTLGYHVKELIGGYEYWVREGFATETDEGVVTNAIDGLTAPLPDPAV